MISSCSMAILTLLSIWSEHWILIRRFPTCWAMYSTMVVFPLLIELETNVVQERLILNAISRKDFSIVGVKVNWIFEEDNCPDFDRDIPLRKIVRFLKSSSTNNWSNANRCCGREFRRWINSNTLQSSLISTTKNKSFNYLNIVWLDTFGR